MSRRRRPSGRTPTTSARSEAEPQDADAPRKPRTGARRVSATRPEGTGGAWPLAPAKAPAKGAAKASGRTTEGKPRPATATHRGIRWQRQPSGLIRWWDTEDRRWVAYRRGEDAPPRPPGWEVERRGAGPATDRSKRAGWRSPYRLVPLVFFIVIVIIGLLAFRRSPTDQTKAEATASAKLEGACLHQNGESGGHAEYSSKPVACSSAQASVRVTQVLPGTPGSPACRAGETGFSFSYPGVRYPHVLCTVAVAAHAG